MLQILMKLMIHLEFRLFSEISNYYFDVFVWLYIPKACYTILIILIYFTATLLHTFFFLEYIMLSCIALSNKYFQLFKSLDSRKCFIFSFLKS